VTKWKSSDYRYLAITHKTHTQRNVYIITVSKTATFNAIFTNKHPNNQILHHLLNLAVVIT